MGKFLDYALPALAAIIAPEIGIPGALAAAGASGGLNYAHNHNIGGALGAAGGSYLGSNIGGSLFPAGSSMGSVGGGLDSAFGQGASSDIASALGSSAGRALSTPMGSVIGSIAGNQLGSSFGASLTPPSPPKPPGPFQPTQAGAAALPASLNSMSSLTPQQQASGLATQGVYGGGNGPQEQSYYTNLLNRQLVDSGGNVSPLSSLSPIEQSYNSKLGFGGETNSNSLLEALSKWKPNS